MSDHEDLYLVCGNKCLVPYSPTVKDAVLTVSTVAGVSNRHITAEDSGSLLLVRSASTIWLQNCFVGAELTVCRYTDEVVLVSPASGMKIATPERDGVVAPYASSAVPQIGMSKYQSVRFVQISNYEWLAIGDHTFTYSNEGS